MSSAPNALSSTANQLLSPINFLLGGLFGGRGNEWNQDYLINILNNGRAVQGMGEGLGASAFGPLRQNLIDNQNQAGQMFWGNYPQLMEQYGQFGSQLNPGMFQGSGITPEMAQMFNNVQGGMEGLQGTGNLAGQVFAGGGWTPQYQQLFDNFGGLMGGQTPQMGNLQDVAQGLLSQRGQTAMTQGYGDRGMDALNAGGMTAALQGLQGAASGMFGNFGQTPTGQNAQQLAMQTLPLLGQGGEFALSKLNSSGTSPFTQYAQGRGADLFGRESVLPLYQAAGMAKDQAGRSFLSQLKGAQRKALARGGGPGAVVSHGLANEGLAEIGDQGAQMEADAFQKMLLAQQGLGLQQNQQGLSALLGGAGTENDLTRTLQSIGSQLFGQTIGTSADLIKALEQVGTQRQLGSLGLINDTEGTANNRMNVLGNLGLGAGQLENSRMNTGNSMMSNYFGTELGAGNLWNSAMGNQNQYALGAGNLQGNLQGVNNSASNSMFGNLTGAGTLGLNQGNAYSNAMNNYFGGMMGGYQFPGNMMTQTWNPLGSLASTGYQYASSGLNSISPTSNAGNPWSGWANGFQPINGRP